MSPSQLTHLDYCMKVCFLITSRNTKPLFRISWHFVTNTTVNIYSGEVSLIISVDIHRKHWDFTLCPSSTVASTFNSRQYLQSLEIPKQISYVLRGIKRAIPRKLVKISDCRVSSFLKTVPGCRVSRHLILIFRIWKFKI